MGIANQLEIALKVDLQGKKRCQSKVFYLVIGTNHKTLINYHLQFLLYNKKLLDRVLIRQLRYLRKEHEQDILMYHLNPNFQDSSGCSMMQKHLGLDIMRDQIWSLVLLNIIKVHHLREKTEKGILSSLKWQSIQT
jgi:hypothetical protein